MQVDVDGSMSFTSNKVVIRRADGSELRITPEYICAREAGEDWDDASVVEISSLLK